MMISSMKVMTTFSAALVASDHHHVDDDQSCYDSDDYEETAADVYEYHPYGNDLDVEEDNANYEDHPYKDSKYAIDCDVAWEETP